MHIYFLGIGGAGIGPLAQVAQQAGFEVSGSDKQHSSYIDYLKEHGIEDITISTSSDVVKEAHKRKPIDWLVYSSALKMEQIGVNQLETVKTLGIRSTKRDEFISEFIKLKKLKMIAVAGTHGKTTTTAMLVWLFKQIKQPISYLVPAKISFGEMGNYSDNSQYFIYEADEYDRNFLAFSPHLSVISGVSWDHHEIYPTREEYISAFKQFISQSNKCVLWEEDANYLKVGGDSLLIQSAGQDLTDLQLKGMYNRKDAWLAITAVKQIDNVDEARLIKMVNNFPGLSRRMEEIYPSLYSDYAHTPDKIRGAISAARETANEKHQRLIVIYEPLTNRRQIHMINDYRDSFNGADHIYWLPSYLAREDPKDRIVEPSELIAKLDNPRIAEPKIRNEHLFDLIKTHLDQGDMVVAMAGGGGGSLDDWLRDNFTPLE
ncbi:MAG: Mur ligase domain-containing protein [Candidatus Saccharimonadales bacterium]